MGAYHLFFAKQSGWVVCVNSTVAAIFFAQKSSSSNWWKLKDFLYIDFFFFLSAHKNLSEKQNSSSVGAHSHKLDFTEWIISDFSYSSIISSNIFGRKWSLRSRVYVLCEIKPILLVIVQLLPFAGKTLQIKSWGNVQSIRALLLSSSNFKFLCEFFLREFGRERNQRRDWSSSISLRFCCCWNLNEYFSIFCCWWWFEIEKGLLNF